MTKRSKAELKRILEDLIRDQCETRPRGLEFIVDDLATVGRPLRKLRIWATLHFTSLGSPFCCFEPGCHLGLFDTKLEQLGDCVRRRLGLRQTFTLEFVDIQSSVHAGVRSKSA